MEDGEDGDWVPNDDDGSSSGSGGDSSAGESDQEEEEGDDFDPTSLYSDFARPRRRSPSPSSALAHPPHEPSADSLPSAPLLLAHHLTTSPSPLTRRRYTALTSPSSSNTNSEGFTSAISSRRLELAQSHSESGWEEARRRELDEGRQRFCVVCTVEERAIVCWPCRAFPSSLLSPCFLADSLTNDVEQAVSPCVRSAART